MAVNSFVKALILVIGVRGYDMRAAILKRLLCRNGYVVLFLMAMVLSCLLLTSCAMTPTHGESRRMREI